MTHFKWRHNTDDRTICSAATVYESVTYWLTESQGRQMLEMLLHLKLIFVVSIQAVKTSLQDSRYLKCHLDLKVKSLLKGGKWIIFTDSYSLRFLLVEIEIWHFSVLLWSLWFLWFCNFVICGRTWVWSGSLGLDCAVGCWRGCSWAPFGGNTRNVKTM